MNSLLRGYRKNVVKSNDKLRKIYTSLKDRLYLSALHFDEKFLNKNFFPCTVGSHTFKSYQDWDDERHKTVVRKGKSNTYHPGWKAALKGMGKKIDALEKIFKRIKDVNKCDCRPIINGPKSKPFYNLGDKLDIDMKVI